MSVRFEFDFTEFEEMRERMEAVGKDIESELNQVLKAEGKKTIEPRISLLMPISSKRNKVHAKNNKWSTQKVGNLELQIKPKKKFQYLVFPNLGIGIRNKEAQHFMEEGRDLAIPKLLEVTQQKLLEKLEEVF